MKPTVWDLKTLRRTWPCTACGSDVDSVQWMKGRFIFCDQHCTWARWIQAWWKKLERRIRRVSGR